MFEPGTLINCCYILREYLGEDSFCERWRASAIFSASDFLFRVLKSEYAVDRAEDDIFAQDAWRSYDVASPAVVSLIDIDRVSGKSFVVSEYGGCGSLEKEFIDGGSFTVAQACRTAIELAEGIDAFHRKNLVYGVLTPQSISVRRSSGTIEELKIEKPSYACLFGSITGGNNDEFRATWAYASPEFKRGEQAVAASDIYSLGVVFYRLLAGKLPYGSRSSGERIRERTASLFHIAASLARRNIPKETAAVVLRALRKNIRSRYPDAVSFIADLRAFLNTLREKAIRSGKADPVADMATLNLKKAKAGVREIVKSLDTVDYFRILSDASISGPDRSALLELLPPFQATPEVEELEELEAEGDEDDEDRDVESYLAEGYDAVERERTAEAQAAFPAEEIGSEKTAAEKPSLADEGNPPPVEPNVPEAPRESIAKIESQPAHRSRRKSPPSVERESPVWRRSGGTPDEIAQKMRFAAQRTNAGKGSVHFIESPTDETAKGIVSAALRSIGADALMIELGAFPEGASLAYLEDRFAAALGKPSGKSAAIPLAARLVRRAGKRRPIVLTAENAERIDRSAHSFIVDLARLAPSSSLCAFFFYSSAQVEPWHTLAELARPPS